MGNFRAAMFNRRAGSPKSKPDEIIKVLSPEKGQKVVDIGVGGGYFALRFAGLVGEAGTVYGIDTDRNFLDNLQAMQDSHSGNIVTIQADGIRFPGGCRDCDLVFARNVYHHIQDRVRYFRDVRQALKPGGKVAIIDYEKGGSFSFHSLFGHNVPRDTIISEMEEAGYGLREEYDFLPEQNFLIFGTGKEN
jgi:ubiquinone/menaquinone biosynthesis C-methylase UbiE